MAEWRLIDGKYTKVQETKRNHKFGKKPKEKVCKKVAQEQKKNEKDKEYKRRMRLCQKATEERKNSEPSMGEARIMNFLRENNIYFIREYYTPKCYNSDTGRMLYFDFYIPHYNLLIEFDGIHHFKPVYGIEKLASQKINDSIKDKWCKQRKWPLLRISCFEMNKIEEIICKAFDKLDPIKKAS